MLNTHTHTAGVRGDDRTNAADGFGEAFFRKRQSYTGGVGLGWMVESRQGFQIRRKASVKAWRWERSSQIEY